MVAKWWFLILPFLLHLFFDSLCEVKYLHFLILFIVVWTHWFHIIQWVMILSLFWCWKCSTFAYWELLWAGSCVLLKRAHHSFSTSFVGKKKSLVQNGIWKRRSGSLVSMLVAMRDHYSQALSEDTARKYTKPLSHWRRAMPVPVTQISLSFSKGS